MGTLNILRKGKLYVQKYMSLVVRKGREYVRMRQLCTWHTLTNQTVLWCKTLFSATLWDSVLTFLFLTQMCWINVRVRGQQYCTLVMVMIHITDHPAISWYFHYCGILPPSADPPIISWSSHHQLIPPTISWSSNHQLFLFSSSNPLTISAISWSSHH